MAPRKTVKATGASRSAVAQPLTESSIDVLRPSQPRAQKRKARPTEEGASARASEPAADTKNTALSSKRLRQSEDVYQIPIFSEAAPAPETDTNLKHLNAVHARLIELTEKLTKVDKHAQFQATATASMKELIQNVGNRVLEVHDNVENMRGEVENVSSEVDEYKKGYTAEDILNKIDEALETITDRFDTVDNKIEKLQYEQTLGWARMQHRFDELEWKLEERPQTGRSINVYGPQGQTLQRIQF